MLHRYQTHFSILVSSLLQTFFHNSSITCIYIIFTALMLISTSIYFPIISPFHVHIFPNLARLVLSLSLGKSSDERESVSLPHIAGSDRRLSAIHSASGSISPSEDMRITSYAASRKSSQQSEQQIEPQQQDSDEEERNHNETTSPKKEKKLKKKEKKKKKKDAEGGADVFFVWLLECFTSYFCGFRFLTFLHFYYWLSFF